MKPDSRKSSGAAMHDDQLTATVVEVVLGWRATPDRFIKPGRSWTPRSRFNPLIRLEVPSCCSTAPAVPVFCLSTPIESSRRTSTLVTGRVRQAANPKRGQSRSRSVRRSESGLVRPRERNPGESERRSMSSPAPGRDRFPPRWGNPLTEDDYAMLATSWITRKSPTPLCFVVSTRSTAVEIVSEAEGKRDCAGLVFPYHFPGEAQAHSYRIRRDNPEWTEDRMESSSPRESIWLAPGSRQSASISRSASHRSNLRILTSQSSLREGEKKAACAIRDSPHSRDGKAEIHPHRHRRRLELARHGREDRGPEGERARCQRTDQRSEPHRMGGPERLHRLRLERSHQRQREMGAERDLPENLRRATPR